MIICKMEIENNNDQQLRKLNLLLHMTIFVLELKKLKNARRKKKNVRRWWVRPINCRKKMQGDYYNLYKEMRMEDDDYFFNYTRMTKVMFDELFQTVKVYLTKKSNRPVIPAECRLLITIRLLASGDCLQSIANAFRMGKSTVCEIFRETCEIIWQVLQPLYIPVMDKLKWESNAKEFEDKWNLPNCVGALDGKHVLIKQPNNSGSLYYSYKKTFSIVLFAACDANYILNVVDIGAYGSQSDGGILKDSVFGKMLEQDKLDLPENQPLPNCATPFPYYFVGDDAFPLKRNIMKPVSGRILSNSQRIYNYRISRARRCIENCFGIIAARWRICHKTIFAEPDTVDRIIKAITSLHNYIMMKQENVKNKRYCNERFVDREMNNKIIEGAWRRVIGCNNAIQPLVGRLGARNARRTAIEYRNILMEYVNDVGSVPWQNEHAHIV